MYTQGVKPAKAVSAAAQNVTSTISSYNSRLGQGRASPGVGSGPREGRRGH